jgi:hypothetical protein
LNHSLYKRVDIVMAGTDVLREWKSSIAVMFPDKAASVTDSGSNKPSIADDNLLKPLQFFGVQRLFSRLSQGPSPPLNPVVVRGLSFDGIAGF